MRRYSPFRISALVLLIGWIPLAIAGLAADADAELPLRRADVGRRSRFAVVGPLFLTNILWFTAIDRVGPSRASLFANLQPFFAVVFALVLLGETLSALGGRRRRRDRRRGSLARASPARATGAAG